MTKQETDSEILVEIKKIAPGRFRWFVVLKSGRKTGISKTVWFAATTIARAAKKEEEEESQ